MSNLNLKFDLTFADLYTQSGLQKLDGVFHDWLNTKHPGLAPLLQSNAHRALPSPTLIDLAPALENFIGELFRIGPNIQQYFLNHSDLAPLYKCKRIFVQRTVAPAYKDVDVDALNIEMVTEQLMQWIGQVNELDYAIHVLKWLETPDEYAEHLQTAKDYAAWCLRHKPGVLFKLPRKIDPQRLVEFEKKRGNLRAKKADLKPRHGFDLTDPGMAQDGAIDHATYCLYCHERDKDTCRTGFVEDEKSFKKDAFGIDLHGCPLDQKISEMNLLYAQGHAIGSLAVICIDNPMVAATGHRICNDCSKACIFQKQTPVDIPQVETRILKDVLALPWGFEIYSLLTRWNPLHNVRPVPKPATNRHVLVVGMGPAGFTLAHHLLNDGHSVVGIDGMKLEALPKNWIDEPIEYADTLFQPLSTRTMAGFGGVAEYGITSRWDKNFLTLIRLLLERRENFSMHGGIRFGTTITTQQAFDMGFDHISLCTGAGQPKQLHLPHQQAKGVRMASDFLMSLQLTGAAKPNSLANLQIRLPLVVIGAGLTAIDSATEALAYYPIQVENFLKRYEVLCKTYGKDYVRSQWTAEDLEIADEFIEHAEALRHLAAIPGDEKSHLPLIEKWGGVKVVYRRDLTSAPAYRTNPHEITSAFEQGVQFVEDFTPTAIHTDMYGAASALQGLKDGEQTTLPARSILVAVGVQSNTSITLDDETYEQHNGFLDLLDDNGQRMIVHPSPKHADTYVARLHEDGRFVSSLGDMHPSFHGSVVKAMASAKNFYPLLSRHLHDRQPATKANLLHVFQRDCQINITSVAQSAEAIDIQVHAPRLSQNYQPGHFYRLQAFADNAHYIGEAIAVNNLSENTDELSFKVFGRGSSTLHIRELQASDNIHIMGPTGEPYGHIDEPSVCISESTDLNPILPFTHHPGSITITNNANDAFEQLEKLLLQNNDQIQNIHRLVAAGSPVFLKRVQQIIANLENPFKQTLATVFSPMQCMMKGICGQCIQRHVDPDTHEESFVFSCANVLQPLESLDVHAMQQRLSQNSCLETLSRLWITV